MRITMHPCKNDTKRWHREKHVVFLARLSFLDCFILYYFVIRLLAQAMAMEGEAVDEEI